MGAWKLSRPRHSLSTPAFPGGNRGRLQKAVEFSVAARTVRSPAGHGARFLLLDSIGHIIATRHGSNIFIQACYGVVEEVHIFGRLRRQKKKLDNGGDPSSWQNVRPAKGVRDSIRSRRILVHRLQLHLARSLLAWHRSLRGPGLSAAPVEKLSGFGNAADDNWVAGAFALDQRARRGHRIHRWRPTGWGAIFGSMNPLQLRVNAFDGDGSVPEVEFYSIA